MIGFFKPASHISELPENEIDENYRRLRWQVFVGIFVGYAGYYLVRKNFTLAMPFLIEEGYSKADLGIALSGVSIAYGLSKLIMGSVSDRSNARVFMSVGLLVSSLIMIAMGTIPFATSSVSVMFSLLMLNGWFQGMGWPPSGRIMVHWFSPRQKNGSLEHCSQCWWWFSWTVSHIRYGRVF
jgi:MFS transporter, OPA family, glycerol-3-phosphate transporter